MYLEDLLIKMTKTRVNSAVCIVVQSDLGSSSSQHLSFPNELFLTFLFQV